MTEGQPQGALPPSAPHVNAELLIVEYKELKREQVARIGFRDNFVYAALAASGAALALAIGRESVQLALLGVPVSGFVLGSMTVSNDDKVTAIGAYIANDLRVRIAAITGAPPAELFGWESARLHARARWLRKLQQWAANIATFIAPGVIAISLHRRLVPSPGTLTSAVLVVDVLLLLWTFVALAMHADLAPTTELQSD